MIVSINFQFFEVTIVVKELLYIHKPFQYTHTANMQLS